MSCYIDDLGRGDLEGKIRDLTQRIDSLETYGNNALAIIAQGAVPGRPGDDGPKGDPGGNVMSVGPFAGVSGLTIPSGTDLVQTSGPSRGILIADTSLNDADVAAHPLAIVKTANGRFFRRDLNYVSILMFGAVSDQVKDCSPAINAALVYLAKFGTVDEPSYKATAPLYVPAGILGYRLGSTINLKQCTRIQGDSFGMAGGYVSRFYPDDNIGYAFIINQYNTFGSGTVADGSGADGSVLDGLSFFGKGKTNPNVLTAVWLRARARVSNCSFYRFSGDGVRITGSVNSGSDTQGNANGFVLEKLRIQNIGRDAIFVRGTDANAGSGTNIDIVDIGGVGINDQSFLGNNWYTCQVDGVGYGSPSCPPSSVDYDGRSWAVRTGQEALASTTAPALTGAGATAWIPHVNNGGYGAWTSGMALRAGGPYVVTDPNARTTFWGCYIEGSAGPVQGSTGSQAYGCFFNEAEVTGGINWLTNRLGVFSTNTLQAGAKGVNTLLGGDPATGRHILMTSASEKGWSFDSMDNDWGLRQNSFYNPFLVTSDTPTHNVGSGRALKNAFLARQFALARTVDGDFGSAGRQIGSISSIAEINGRQVARDDIFFYLDANPGGKIGTLCITPGIVGSGAVFKDFGSIDA